MNTTGIRRRIYLAGPGLRIGLDSLVRYRLEYSARLRELGYTVVDPYAPLVEQFRGTLSAISEQVSQEEHERAFLAAIDKASSADPYFAMLRSAVSKGGLAAIEGKSLCELATAQQVREIHSLDAQYVSGCDVLIAYLPCPSQGTMREAAVARSRGILRFVFGGTEGPQCIHAQAFDAGYSTFEQLIPVLEFLNSGEGPYLTTNPVTAARGHVLLYAVEVASLFPHILARVAGELSHPRRLFSFCCERSHVHELAQKLPVMLRLGEVESLSVLTKDGSPHDVQMHTIVQEVVENLAYTGPVLHHVIEHGHLCQISSETVRASRHLHKIEASLLLEQQSTSLPHPSPHSEPLRPCVAVLVGGKSDLATVEESGLRDLLAKEGISCYFDVISSDREPERLRRLCLANAGRWDAVIAIAGGVPNLPVVAKSWLPSLPVISVPVEERPDVAVTALTTPSDAPVMLTGYGERGARKAGKLLVQLLKWRGRRIDHPIAAAPVAQ